MNNKSNIYWFQKVSTFVFYMILLMWLFSYRSTPSAHAQEENTGYEFGGLPANAHISMIQAIQSRPSSVLSNGVYFVVGHYESDGLWGIGHLAAATGNEPPSWESSIWFIVQEETNWRVALQGTSAFNDLLIDLPSSLKSRVNIPNKNNTNNQITSNTFRFPWDKSQQWRYTNSWHGGTNMALDFAPTNVPPSNMWILASASGTVTLVCGDSYQAAIDLTTPNGVMTYRHVDYNSFIAQNLNGKTVTQGQKLALLYNGSVGGGWFDISIPYPYAACAQGSSPSCIHIQFLTYCGSGSAAHVHWTLPTKSTTVDGWQIDSNGLWSQSGQPTRSTGALFSSTNSSSLLPSTFEDTPSDYWAWQYIESLYSAGITGGCATSPLNYCPENLVTRDQMAIFLERGIQGSSFVPPNVSPTFGDTTGNFAEDWIEALKNDGITGGCGNGNYCPTSGVTRAQMAIFLERAMHGSSFFPPNATPTFGDTVGNFAEDWIEALKNDAITTGCGNGNYCPDDIVTRAQMAVFLVKAFNLP